MAALVLFFYRVLLSTVRGIGGRQQKPSLFFQLISAYLVYYSEVVRDPSIGELQFALRLPQILCQANPAWDRAGTQDWKRLCRRPGRRVAGHYGPLL